MLRISRRNFLKTASASAVCAALWNRALPLMANPLGLPLGLQLYSVRDVLPKDYEGTLKQLGALGYREVEAAGFFGHTPSEVKQAMDHAGLRCVSAHYPLKDLLPKLDETIQFGKDLGLQFIVCSSPMLKDSSRVKEPDSRTARESMTIDDWRWNAEQFNHIGEKVNAAGMKFAYHNHAGVPRREWCDVLRRTDEVDGPGKGEHGAGLRVGSGRRPEARRTAIALCDAHFHAARKRLQDGTRRSSLACTAINGVGTRNN